MERRRLFVAVWPPGEVVGALARLSRPERKGLRWTTPDQWHITLQFLGSLDADAEAAVHSVLAHTDWAGAGPVRATAGPAPLVMSRSLLCLPVDGVDRLAVAARAAGTAAGLTRSGDNRDRPFIGHLTLARARVPGALRDLPAERFEQSWDVGEVTLVRSDLDPAGARYTVCDRWRLDASRD